MDNLVCTDCATTYYSAAAASMVERGERCDCGAPLRLVGEERQAEVPVGAPADRRSEGEVRPGGRRFTRE
jgi:hypothetical protein